MVELQAVVAAYWRREVPWAADASEDVVVLDRNTSDADVARVVASLAYDPETLANDIQETTRNILNSDRVIVAGGLRLRSGAFEMAPSCCCGLEGWRDWFEVRNGGHSPWMGHDPSPGIECDGESALAHTDMGSQANKTRKLEYADIHAALDRAAQDMKDFIGVLRAWLVRHGGDPKVADWFDATFEITAQKPKTSH